MSSHRFPNAALKRWSPELVDAATIERFEDGRLLDLDALAAAHDAANVPTTLAEAIARKYKRANRNTATPRLVENSSPMGVIGPRLWAEIYDFVLKFEGTAAEAWAFTEKVLARLPKIGCPCNTDFFKYREMHPLDISSIDAHFAWWSNLQNEVSVKNGREPRVRSAARLQWGLDDPAPPPADYFAQVRVMSLPRTPERLAKMWSAWPEDWPFERPDVIEAIDGEAITPKHGWRGGRGAWGLILTCIKALNEYIATNPTKPLMLLEDDCEWIDGAMLRLLDFVGRLPPDFDAAFPGAQHLKDTIPAGKGIVRALGAHRMHCIIISPHYAPILKKLWEDYDFIQDHLLTAESPKRKYYCAEPYLCFQQANVSNLLGHYVPDRAGNNFAGESGISRPDNNHDRYERTYPLKCGGTKRFIDVRERYAFNGATIKTDRGMLCVFRGNDSGVLKYRWIEVGATTPFGSATQLPIICNDDPRLISHRGRIYMSTNFWWGKWEGNQIELRELTIDSSGSVQLHDVAKFKDDAALWPGYVKPQHEKNWAPFSHDGRFLYVYSINPHRILEVDLEAGRAKLVHETTIQQSPWAFAAGLELRCNAPPVRLADGTYLSTFHVRNADGDYWTGFYRFAGESPFRILSMSREPVLWPEDSDGVCWRNGPGWKLLFVQGMELIGDTLRLWGGDNDHSVMMAELPLATAISSLAPAL